MQVHSDIYSLPAFRRAVVTIGTFDGVHMGHRQIIKQLIEKAISINGETVIITFHPHPRKIVGLDSPVIHLINNTAEKIKLLSNLGIDHLVIVPFTEAFANQSAIAYVEDFLIKNFHPHTLIIGYDHRFGKGRAGDFRLLEDYAEKQGFQLIEIPQHLLHESAISSTRIREDVQKGQIERANELLGYPYFFTGTVIEGNKLGRTLEFPTANLEVADKEKLIPGNGVYAVELEILEKKAGFSAGRTETAKEDQKETAKRETVTATYGMHKHSRRLQGMMNIGIRPTIQGIKQVIEVHIFDFNEDIYGFQLRVHMKHFKNGKKFDGLPALKEQLHIDRSTAIKQLRDQKASDLL